MAKGRHSDAPPSEDPAPMFNVPKEDAKPAEANPVVPPANNGAVKPDRKPPERIPLSDELQTAAKMDRLLSKMTPARAVHTLDYLMGIYRSKIEKAPAT